MAAEILLRIRAPDPGGRDDPIAAKSADVIERAPAIPTMTIEEARKSVDQSFDDVRPDRVIENGRGADLHGAEAEQEIIQRVREFADAADSGKLPIGKSLRHLRHLRERLRQDGGPAETAARDEPIHVHFELERVR